MLSRRLLSAFLFTSASLTLSGCPERPATKSSDAEADQAIRAEYAPDLEAFKRSYIVKLSQDSKPILRWNESDGLVSFFQGALPKAIKTLDEVVAANPQDEMSRVGLVRATIEIIELYQQLAEMEGVLLPQ